jgi:hypothetical protein
MATYIGFYNPDPAFAARNAKNARREKGPNTSFQDKVQALPGALPQGTSIIGSYATMSNERPAVMIVETSDPSGLAFISSYYEGFLNFDWTPTQVIGGNQAERDQWRQQVS